jgi:hypothetical protein
MTVRRGDRSKMTMNRTSDRNVIQHRLLELAYTTDARITAPALAYFAPCSIEDAEAVLDDLVTRNRISLEIDDEGILTYEVPDRQKLQPRHEPVPPSALVRAVPRGPLALRDGRDASPGLAAALSLVLPGAGQMYTGRVAGGLFWFLAVSLGYALILPGVFLHLLCVASAAASAHRLNSNLSRAALLRG